MAAIKHSLAHVLGAELKELGLELSYNVPDLFYRVEESKETALVIGRLQIQSAYLTSHSYPIFQCTHPIEPVHIDHKIMEIAGYALSCECNHCKKSQ